MFTNIVWATDGSEHADRALQFAADIAQRDGAKLHVVHVVEKLPARKMAGDLNIHVDEEQLKDKVTRQTRQVAAERKGSVTLHLVTGRSGHVAQRIVDITTETGGDLIVVGTRGHSAVVGAMVGSVAQDLLHLAPCPVLAVAPGRTSSDTPAASQSLTPAR
jgi:nucleotide-binding universal stress UspA family protein